MNRTQIPAAAACAMALCLLAPLPAAAAETTSTAAPATTETATAPPATTPPPAAGTTVTLDTGVAYSDIVIGTGDPFSTESLCRIHYTGSLENGKIFDTSRDKTVPVPLQIGRDGTEVIPGMTAGIQGMRKGGRRILHIPPDQAYGEHGRLPSIPGNATLVFDVELVEVIK